MSLTTPQSIITFALKAVGVLGVGQTALAADNQDAFDALNAMLGIWNRKRWLIWHLLDVSVQSTGEQTYTVGPGQQFDVSRPDRLEAAFFDQIITSQPNPVRYPLEILESREDYSSIALPTLQSWPQYVFYDAAFPTGILYPWPVPQASDYTMHILVKDTITAFTAYVQQINLPPEYFEALWSNLALRLGAIYPGSAISPATEAIAKSSLAVLRGANAQIPRLKMPAGIGRPALYNIFSNQDY